MSMTSDAKRALSTTIRSLRERLLSDLHAATEGSGHFLVVALGPLLHERPGQRGVNLFLDADLPGGHTGLDLGEVLAGLLLGGLLGQAHLPAPVATGALFTTESVPNGNLMVVNPGYRPGIARALVRELHLPLAFKLVA